MLRERLAGYFIQRRRRDIDDWHEPGLFPKHETAERSYRLSGDFERFLRRCARLLCRGGGGSGG